MTLAYAIAAAVLGPVIGIVHSSFAKSYGLNGLYPNSDVKRRIIILIWHLPSLTWSALAFAILAARLSGGANFPLTAVAIFVFGISGAGNLWAHQKLFIGGILLLLTALLVLSDWALNPNYSHF
jgi:hypothetical protein